MEDLTQHFRICRQCKRPAVVILEEIDQFALREKQSLFYTLLDLMQHADLLFVVIGLTDVANLKLEKRILSRLSAQYVIMPTPTGRDVCEVLYERLTQPFKEFQITTLPSSSSPYSSSCKRNSIGKDGIHTGSSTPRISDVSQASKERYLREGSSTFSVQEYCDEFIKRIATLFGECESNTQDIRHGSNSKKTTSAEFLSDDEDVEEVAKEINRATSSLSSSSCSGVKSKARLQGTLFSLINRHVNWGRNLDHFMKAASNAVGQLSESQPFISKEIIEKSIAALDPPSLLEKLTWLPNLQWYLCIVIYRLQARGVKREITIEQVKSDLDKLFGTISSSQAKESDIFQALLCLVDLGLLSIHATGVSSESSQKSKINTIPIRNVNISSVVRLVPPNHEFKDAFVAGTGGNREDRGAGFIGSSNSKTSINDSSSSMPLLRVSERIRHAVLEPMDTIDHVLKDSDTICLR